MAAVKRWNHANTTPTTLNGASKDAAVAGPALDMALVKSGSLSALITVDAETDTIAIEALWEVSNVGGAGPWYEVVGATNAPPVVWAAGTAAADAAVTRVLEAPSCVYSSKYSRAAVRCRFIAPAAADTYDIGYNFTQAQE